MKKIFNLFILTIPVIFSFSQKVENVHAEQQGNQVVITYDITDAQASQKFDVSLYYSQNGYNWNQSIYGLTGDIGNEVVPGNNKTINWDALQELDRLTGSGFRFKVKATLTKNNLTIKENVNTETTSFNGNSGNFIDTRDGKSYKWVKIGEQIWMAENLKFKANSGSSCYNNENKMCEIYGRLYKWETAVEACPKEWHLPSNDEWMELVNFLGGIKIAAGKMQEVGTVYWNKLNAASSNSSGFSCIPGGFRTGGGAFDDLGRAAFFWAGDESREKTEFMSGNKDLKADWWNCNKNDSKIRRGNWSTLNSFSIRCIKN